MLEFEKRFFDYIQLTLGVQMKATLQNFKWVVTVIHCELFWLTYPYVALRMGLENELSYDSLSMANNS